jgi:molecular chaperone GrpE (heat shock protein)
MMYDTPPRTTKWPFLLFDVILLALAGFLLSQAAKPLGTVEIAAVCALGIIGAWVAVTPFLRDQSAAVKLYEQANLSGTLAQIGELESVAQKIALASSQWQGVQETSARTVSTASALVDRMSSEAKAFSNLLTEADQREKQNLRLELEKVRRGEQEQLQVLVHLLDHVYALYLAGIRSGQDGLVAQLSQFRAAVQDATRRIGLVVHEAKPGDGFDPNLHQTINGSDPAAGTPIDHCVACGYSYQGQGLRRIVVSTGAGLPEPASENEPQISEA